MLWLALAFPRLPLEAGDQRAQDSAAGTVVVEQGRVCAVDDTAAAAGLVPGMRLSTARGMLPEARLVDRDAALLAREAQRLDEFACFAGNLTPTVCVEPPALVLLEVGGSLRLFGGLPPILERVFEACAERGLSACVAAAPMPRAAEWLALAQAGAARSGRSDPSRAPDRTARGRRAGGSDPAGRAGVPESLAVRDTLAACAFSIEAIPQLIGRLPLGVVGGSAEVQARLAGFGLRTVADLLALPRAGLASRAGPELSNRLAQALGELPDPRAGFIFPQSFRQAIELPGTVSDAPMLAFPARRLLGDLCGWLAARQAGAAACTLHLAPERRGVPPVAIRLALAGPSRDPARFERLLREKLARTILPAPVGDLILEAGGEGGDAGEVVPLPGETPGLFERRRPEVPVDVLVERLRARFGEAAVHGLVAVPEHRPECATRPAAIGLPSPEPGAQPGRPPWLLPEPELLPELGGRPSRRGEPLELFGTAERIESGWWDEGEHDAGAGGSATGDVRRDYFFARTPRGQWWWIFRDARGWWGQGLGPALVGRAPAQDAGRAEGSGRA